MWTTMQLSTTTTTTQLVNTQPGCRKSSRCSLSVHFDTSFSYPGTTICAGTDRVAEVPAHSAGQDLGPRQGAQDQQRPASRNGAGNSPTVYVGNLQWWTTDAEIEALCGQFGSVSSIRFFEERSNGKSKGYCLVEFADAASAAQCKAKLHGYIPCHRPSLRK